MEYSAILLAGGSGRRMGGDRKKQYMELLGKPVLYYPLMAFENSWVDEVVLVVSPDDEDYVLTNIVEKYGFKKVSRIIPGGAERYDSVYNGIQAAEGRFVLIHDAARAFVTPEIIDNVAEELLKYKACVVGMPSKDTVKLSDAKGFVSETPDRSSVWIIQTPQAFLRSELLEAYDKLKAIPDGFAGITDDAMIMEKSGGRPVKLIEGSYDNIKITTPEDMVFAVEILNKRGNCDSI